MVKKLIGGISLSPPLQVLKQKLTISQEKILNFEPAMVFIPLSQHIGAPSHPVVKIGDSVKRGQLIGREDGFVSVPIHASVSGKVLDITDWPDQNNQTVTTIIIENDFKHRSEQPIKFPWQAAKSAEILPKIQQAGIVGKGGAAFPTHVKFALDQKKIDTLIINGAECEPFLHSDDLLMREEADAIIEGALIARKLLGAPNIVIGIEDDKPQAIQKMTAAANNYPFILVTSLPAVYPTGGEKQLINILCEREIPLGKLPADIGVVVLNVATSYAIAQAVCFDRPLIERFTTVTGDVKEPKIVKSPIGTLTGELIDFAGGFVGTPAKVLLGGPMMGKTVATLRVPITKNSNGIVVFNQENAPIFTENPCIRCNKCVEACPMRLMPASIDQYFRVGDFDKCAELLADACISCGACTFVCPARRDLATTITQAKQKVLALKKEALANG